MAQRYEDITQGVEHCIDDALHTEEASQRTVWTTPSTGIPKQARGDRRNGDMVVTGPEPAGYTQSGLRSLGAWPTTGLRHRAACWYVRVVHWGIGR